MHGLIMDRPLLISSLLEFGARNHAGSVIVSRTTEGPIHRYTLADAHGRAKQLAKAMARLGVDRGDRPRINSRHRRQPEGVLHRDRRGRHKGYSRVLSCASRADKPISPRSNRRTGLLLVGRDHDRSGPL